MARASVSPPGRFEHPASARLPAGEPVVEVLADGVDLPAMKSQFQPATLPSMLNLLCHAVDGGSAEQGKGDQKRRQQIDPLTPAGAPAACSSIAVVLRWAWWLAAFLSWRVVYQKIL